MFLKSFSPGDNNNSYSHAAFLQYASRKWILSFQEEYVNKNYSAEVGYVPRKNYIKLNPNCRLSFFPCKKRPRIKSWATL